MIFSKFASEQMAMRAIAMYANELGLRTKRGNLFENRTIEYILNNPVYIGQVRWTPTGRVRRDYHNPNSIIAEGKHEPIIDMELWNRVQEALKLQKDLYGKWQKASANMTTWLKSLVKCSNCEKTLTPTAHVYLQCNSYAKGTCQVSHFIKITTIEELVLEQLRETFQSELEINIVPKARDITVKSEYDLLRERLDKLLLKEQRIKEAYQDGIDTLAEYKANKRRLEQERQETEQQLSDIKTNLSAVNEQGETIHKRIKNVFTLLTDPTIDMQVKYDTAHFLIDKIVYRKQDKTVEIWYK